MTKKVFIITLLFVPLLAFSQSACAGYAGIKNDSLECLQGISVYREFKKMNLRENAVREWKKVYVKCPQIKKIIYQDGVKFLKQDIVHTQDENIRKLLIDSLMRIYDNRIKYFGDEDFVNGRKGFDLYYLDKKQTAIARNLMYSSAANRKEKTQLSVVAALVKATVDLGNNQLLNTTELINTYFLCDSILNVKLRIVKDENKKVKIKQTQKSVKKFFAESELIRQEQFMHLLEHKFSDNLDNLDSLNKIMVILSAANYSKSGLFYKIAKKIDILNPTASNAYILAGIEIENNNYEKAAEYFQKAINLEKSNRQKALYHKDYAVMQYTFLKDFRQAKKSFENSLQCAKTAKTYCAMGDMYAAYHYSFKNKSLEHSALLWLATDYYLKAKQLNPKLASKADKRIAYYREYFPTKEDIFFFGLKPGQSYKIGGWINQSTIVRVR